MHDGYCSRAEGLNEGYLPITDLVIMFDMTSRFFEYLNRTERESCSCCACILVDMYTYSRLALG